MLNWILVSVVALLLYITSDTFAKTTSEKLGGLRSTILIAGLTAVALLIAIPFVGIGTINPAVIFYSIVIGLTVGTGTVLVFTALETEQVSNVMALLELAYVVVALYGAIGLNEGITQAQWIAITLIIFGTLFVSTTERFKLNKMLIVAVVGQILWGIWYIPFVYSIKAGANFTTPLLIGAVFFTTLLSVIYIFRSKKHKQKKWNFTPHLVTATLVVGLTYGFGLVFFGYLATINTVALGAALVATEPAFVILLGRFIYKDKFITHQLFGFAIMILGALILTLA